ncbi:MAG: zinc transporter ZupT [Paludibacter sp.]|jgi:ZIP family zinc transporter|nr:zinc transporter ZupT [Bacteroidales bacterium]HOG05054.1 zinc transporter ZupT [Paludibacter sp.]HPM09869.1 zinc transporter ZupT [Paludibacter sp.]
MESNVLFAFGLTLFAGLATGIGSFIGLLSKKFNPKFLAGSLGFSAGVMIYVSLVEIFFEAKKALMLEYGDKLGYAYTTIAFFAGIAFIAIIDRMIPSMDNPHEIKKTKNYDSLAVNNKKLMRMGLFSAFAIAVHNFPEGLATFMAGMTNPTLGISIAVAIAIHNIPEGLAVSVPIYYATGSKKKAFVLSFLSGLSEPVGAIIGYFFLRWFFTESVLGFIFAAVAGIMVFISLDELLPTAEEYGEHHVAIYGLIAGMAVMALSLVLMA